MQYKKSFLLLHFSSILCFSYHISFKTCNYVAINARRSPLSHHNTEALFQTNFKVMRLFYENVFNHNSCAFKDI